MYHLCLLRIKYSYCSFGIMRAAGCSRIDWSAMRTGSGLTNSSTLTYRSLGARLRRWSRTSQSYMGTSCSLGLSRSTGWLKIKKRYKAYIALYWFGYMLAVLDTHIYNASNYLDITFLCYSVLFYFEWYTIRVIYIYIYHVYFISSDFF